MKALRTALALVEEFRKYDPEIPAQMVSAFLDIAEHPGTTGSDVVARIGTTTSSTSRLVWTLTDRLGLIEHTIDPTDRRRRPLALTAKGHELADRVRAIVGGRS